MNLGGTCPESLGGGWGRIYCQLSLLGVTCSAVTIPPGPQSVVLYDSGRTEDAWPDISLQMLLSEEFLTEVP